MQQNLFGGSRAPLRELDFSLTEFFPNRDAVRNANQVRVFEFDSGPFISIIEQGVDSNFHTLGVK